jgi:fructose-1,6-bisphosphatase-3
MSAKRMRVSDTDKGVEIQQQINDLEKLLYAYRHGIFKERERKK